MNKKPLIKQGWLRALLFLVFFILVIAILAAKQSVIASQLKIQMTAGDSGAIHPLYSLLGIVLSSLVSFITVFIFRKLVDRKSLLSLGFNTRGYIPHALAGFFLAPLMLGIGTFIFVALGYLHWIDLQVDSTSLFINLVLMLVIAFAEEMVFRGYLLGNLMESMSRYAALGISAFVFTAFHGSNPGVNPLAIINLFIGGLLLGANFIYTRNLWFSVLFHFAWNFYQGPVLGYKVSGLELNSVFQHELSGPPSLTGNAFGFEASLINGMLGLISTILLVWVYERKRTKSLAPAAV